MDLWNLLPKDIALWHWWLILAILAFIGEVFTTGFFLACVSIGAVLAALGDVFGAGFSLQLALLALGLLISAIKIRPLLMKFFYSDVVLRTNVDGLIGKTGVVISKISEDSDEGRVKIGGTEWWAFASDEKTVETGTKVVIDRIEGTKAYVSLKEKNKGGC